MKLDKFDCGYAAGAIVGIIGTNISQLDVRGFIIAFTLCVAITIGFRWLAREK